MNNYNYFCSILPWVSVFHSIRMKHSNEHFTYCCSTILSAIVYKSLSSLWNDLFLDFLCSISYHQFSIGWNMLAKRNSWSNSWYYTGVTWGNLSRSLSLNMRRLLSLQKHHFSSHGLSHKYIWKLKKAMWCCWDTVSAAGAEQFKCCCCAWQHVE